jgi:DNA polymerase elongation subunit (family B)
LESLFVQLFRNRSVASHSFVYKYADPSDNEKSKVLEVAAKDCRRTRRFIRETVEAGGFSRYQLHNDLPCAQAYLYERRIFPLAFARVEITAQGLKYRLLDSVESVDYKVPPLRVMRLNLDIAKRGKIAKLGDPIRNIVLSQEDETASIDSGDDKDKLLQLVERVQKFDPDILMTRGGDAHILPYLAEKALINGVSGVFSLSRESVPLETQRRHGTTFFSYGRTYHRAATRRLYGRIHIDENNTFILRECGMAGLIEISRTCRVPLHRAARSSIGSSMSSLQFYQAINDDMLIPRNKRIPEAFKSAYELLVGDRGGFVFEPKMGIHDQVGEVDFSSMYPSLMAKYNISAETLLCKCCPRSSLRVPRLGYHICEKRVGIVPKVLGFVISKRLRYKRLKRTSSNAKLREIYDRRQGALKWILVTCFGYLGYKNAKFGTIDGHIGVCAFGREAFLAAAHIAEERGFSVVHGIVDSLWLKKADASTRDYIDLCKEISKETGVPLNFEGRYKWIVFLPSRTHPNVAVLNRYYGVRGDGEIKVRGLEVRRRDTPRFIYDAQIEMLRVFATANNSKLFVKKIRQALKVVEKHRRRLLDGEVPVGDLIVTKRLSKEVENYRQRVSQMIAAEQLLKEGLKAPAGTNVRFLFTSAENKRYERRVRAEALVEDNASADIKKYLILLYSAAANILSPFGYSEEDVLNSIRGQQCTSLPSFCHRTPA